MIVVFLFLFIAFSRLPHFLLFFQDAYFMSPAGRTYDALGLVKHISEQTAAALEETHEVLASGSAQNRCSRDNDKENIENTTFKQELVTSKLPSKVMVRKLP